MYNFLNSTMYIVHITQVGYNNLLEKYIMNKSLMLAQLVNSF